MDVLNLACNEKDEKKDFSLAFIGVYSKFWLMLPHGDAPW